MSVMTRLLEVDRRATRGDGVDDLCGAAKALHESSLLSSTLLSAGSEFLSRVAMSFGF